MKVKNPSTGNFEEVYVKALDSLPVGTEVDFTGSTSDIPVGWEQVASTEDLTLPTTDTTALTINNYSFKRYGNVYNLMIFAKLKSNLSTNTEYKVLTYNFPLFSCGDMIYTSDTTQAGSFIINHSGLYINLSKNNGENASVLLNVSWIN